jgi:hypothetical protein
MGEDRLNGLAHLYINRDIPLDYGKVIDEFGRTIVVSVSANIFFNFCIVLCFRPVCACMKEAVFCD